MITQASVTEVLIYYDGPRLSAFRADDGSHMLGVHVEDLPTKEALWLVVVVPPEVFNAVMADKYDLNFAFGRDRLEAYIAVQAGGVGCVVSVTPLEDVPVDWLPEPNS